MKRLLITGSRSWVDHSTIEQALRGAFRDFKPEPVTLVSGSARGADDIAELIWSAYVGEYFIERHPASNYSHPLVRNDKMIELGADLVLAFPTKCVKLNCPRLDGHFSHGTDYTIKAAKRAGIPVKVFEERRG